MVEADDAKSHHDVWRYTDVERFDQERATILGRLPRALAHEITPITLAKDFDIGQQIQSALRSGVNERLTFGRF